MSEKSKFWILISLLILSIILIIVINTDYNRILVSYLLI
jgi:hypothetical protein